MGEKKFDFDNCGSFGLSSRTYSNWPVNLAQNGFFQIIKHFLSSTQTPFSSPVSVSRAGVQSAAVSAAYIPFGCKFPPTVLAPDLPLIHGALVETNGEFSTHIRKINVFSSPSPPLGSYHTFVLFGSYFPESFICTPYTRVCLSPLQVETPPRSEKDRFEARNTHSPPKYFVLPTLVFF